MSIVIGTLILWGLTALFVIPLTNYLVGRKLQEPQYAHLAADNLTEAEQQELDGLVLPRYILADVIVLGLAGLIAGLLGYWFVGIALDLKGWPGMIAFIGLSLLGAAMHGGA